VFFFETIELLNAYIAKQVASPPSKYYPLFLARLTQMFQSLCGAEMVATKGFPYLGYTALRNIFDNVVLTSAVMQKLTDFETIEGLEPDKSFDLVVAKKNRKNIEFAIREQMTGKRSQLSGNVRSQIERWDALFDYETHGARLSIAQNIGWLRGEEPLSVLPEFNERSFALFVNRYLEVTWMTHRLIPLVQPPKSSMPDEWCTKWEIIDDSFEKMVSALKEELKKEIGQAIPEFVKAKFPFRAKSHFPYDA